MHLGGLIEFVRNHTEILDAQQSFYDAVLYLTQTLDRYEHQQNAILRVLAESNNGILCHTLFTPSQIEADREA